MHVCNGPETPKRVLFLERRAAVKERRRKQQLASHTQLSFWDPFVRLAKVAKPRAENWPFLHRVGSSHWAKKDLLIPIGIFREQGLEFTIVIWNQFILYSKN